MKIKSLLLISGLISVLSGCTNSSSISSEGSTSLSVSDSSLITSTQDSSTSSETSGTSSSSSGSSTSSSVNNSSLPVWDQNSIYYNARHISLFGSATPAGMATFQTDTAVIWNIDASLDNYGGVQTPTLRLDFSKAVIFEMEVLSSYSQYIVKLGVEGESKNYYVLADEGTTGLISINVVDAMLCDKFRSRVTMPDPGYQTGWKYDNQIKNCNLQILAKGPDGERQTAELVIDHVAIYNDQEAVTSVNVDSTEIVDGTLTKLKGSSPVTLTASISPETIANQNVIWSSFDPTVATVNQGVVNFVGVGLTTIIAKSAIDQSKVASLPVVVTSGYEVPSSLISRLSTLSYEGAATSLQDFTDLFRTTWGPTISQSVTIEQLTALDDHMFDGSLRVENYFNSSNSGQVSEANAHLSGGQAKATLTLSGISSATVYRNIDGHLYSQSTLGTLGVGYASYSPWTRLGSYTEQTIVVSGTNAYKYEVKVFPSSLINDYQTTDFMDTSKWTIPDRTKQTIDPVIHALSPASLVNDAGTLVMTQNKYPEANYAFGGIVSNLMSVATGSSVQMLLNITGLNQKSEFVKTMWEIKILYYQSNGTTVVSSNPLKVASGNVTGLQQITFSPSKGNFRIYLVVNGSDIGEQFVGAQVRLNHFKLYTLESGI